MPVDSLRRELRALADPAKAVVLQRFFKTGPGEYAEGDRFLGIKVPQIRALVRKYRELDAADALQLLDSPLHEERLLALLLLVQRFGRAGQAEQRAIYRAYLAHTACINNWDLVDCSAEHIVGAWLRERSRAPLHKLARSKSIWERRIAVLATFHFIKRGEFDETLCIAERLLDDGHDLIHKAVGWMLREVGNRDRKTEEAFLLQHYHDMPRTMLRYAIEKFPEGRRRRYLAGTL